MSLDDSVIGQAHEENIRRLAIDFPDIEPSIISGEYMGVVAKLNSEARLKEFIPILARRQTEKWCNYFMRKVDIRNDIFY